MAEVIEKCCANDFEMILTIINDAAGAYKGVIPAECWQEPYMPRAELAHEISSGVVFWGWREAGELIGVMGIQHVRDVTLIRHAYVRTAHRNRGIGGKLLARLLRQISKPALVGTWADASWAVRFYEKHGFRLVEPTVKDNLLNEYWSIPSRQVVNSVVLADD
ncbi:MAG: GNAT family N-acetyltransferase [Bacillota bacterium]